jgi:hypothetical protein
LVPNISNKRNTYCCDNGIDTNYNFLYSDIQCQRIISDGGYFRNTKLFKKIENKELLLPADQLLPNKTLPMSYKKKADDTLALSKNIMKPYRGPYNEGSVEMVFNYRVSHARRAVENVFRIMVSTFRMLRKPLLLEPEKVTNIVMTYVLLMVVIHLVFCIFDSLTPGEYSGH